MNAVGVVEVTQHVDARPDEVFPYFVDAAKYTRWKGLDAEFDPRPGGIYKVKMWDGGGVEGRYVVVDPPRRVVFTWGWHGPGLPEGFAEVPPGSTTVEVTFEPAGEGTLVRLRHTGLPTEAAAVVHRWGWTTYGARLGDVTAGKDPGPDPGPALAARYRTGTPHPD